MVFTLIGYRLSILRRLDGAYRTLTNERPGAASASEPVH